MVTKKEAREAGRVHARRVQALPIVGDITQEVQPGPLPDDQTDPLAELQHDTVLENPPELQPPEFKEETTISTDELENLDEVMGQAAEAQHSADESWALQEGGLPEVQPEPVPPQPPVKKEYQARRFTPDTVIALGPESGKPGTVAHWLRGVLLEVLDSKRKDGQKLSDQTCTVGEWTQQVIKQQTNCPSKSKPCRDNVWAQFVTGYLRWQVNHGQIRLVPQK